MLSRRELFRAAGVVAGAATVAPLVRAQPPADPAAPAGGKFVLNKLPYAYDALEPIIDAETMTIHHTKHQNAYVEALNTLLGGSAPAMLGKPVEEVVKNLKSVPESARQAVKNNAGGVWNHEFFWSVMTKPDTNKPPTGELLKAIDDSFKGGFAKLLDGIVTFGTGRFGSGWVWLVPGKEKPLELVTTANQDNPLMDDMPRKPLLGVDVWEHAYYLKYRNLRKKYLEEWVKLINWDTVAANFAARETKAPARER